MTLRRESRGVLSKALAVRFAALGLVRYPPDGSGAAVPCYVEDMPPNAPDELVLIRTHPGNRALDVSGYENPELEVMYRTATTAGLQAGSDGAEALRRGVKDDAEVTWDEGGEHEVHVALCDADARATRKGSDPKGRPVWSFFLQTHVLEAHP